MGALRHFLSCLLATGAVVSASALPKLTPELARGLYTTYAACPAYWKAVSSCLPRKLKPEEKAAFQTSIDQLLAIGGQNMAWLAEKGQLSEGMQARIVAAAADRVKLMAGGSCATAPVLIQEFRDKCAALAENVTTANYEEVLPGPQASEDEVATSAAKFIVDTCYEQIDDVTRISSFARMMKWPQLSDDQRNMLKPADANGFDGWMVDYEGTTFVVVINHSTLKGRPAEVCQVSAPLEAAPILRRIKNAIRTLPIGRHDALGASHDFFQLVEHPKVKTAMMNVGSSTEHDFVTVAFTGIK